MTNAFVIDLKCLVPQHGRCCCGCRYHVEDFHHCTTVKETPNCVCSDHKGWICMPPDFHGAHSGWSEHGLCELWTPKEDATTWSVKVGL